MTFSKKTQLGFYFLPVIFNVFIYLTLKTEPLVIVDPVSGFDHKQYRISFITDQKKQGYSSIHLLDTCTNTLSYHYTLNNKLGAPTVRLLIESSIEKFIDLSHFNKLVIKLKSKNEKKIPVILCKPIPFHSTPSEINTYHLLINYADPTIKFKKQDLHFVDFLTPDWWFSFASNQDYQNIGNNIKFTKYIIFSNSSFQNNFNEDIVTISELRFEYDFSDFVIWATICSIFYYLMLILLFYFPKKIGVDTIYLVYKKIETVNYEDLDRQNIITYLQGNFQNTSLTLSDVQKATGIHERKIPVIIKKYTQLTFKQYINQLRIEKAKALLLKTDLPISEVAYEAGYNNISHFNRVFKTEENCSPQEYKANNTRLN